MSDTKRLQDGICQDAVCIDAGRVYDSCADKDCAEDLRVYFTERDQQMLDCAQSARIRKAEVLTTCIDVEALPFNHGYYSCDLTFFLEVTAELCSCRSQPSCTVSGVAMFQKKVILFGGEGSVKVFSSEFTPDQMDQQEMPRQTLPRCCVQVAEPVVLHSQLADLCECRCCSVCSCSLIPQSLSARFGGTFCEGSKDGKALLVSIGIFSIVQLVRSVQMLVPVYDFCMPTKECTPTGDNPCDAFRKMNFPVDEFFPPKQGKDGGCGCGCR